ncbi:DinB family protein [Mucilaginibacter sp. McL0603]|uniref:DinB family protein n=1 Tax=Mucilaginibacter sp. McL0603 TaxID=3415670 RepID=UPI003CE908C1
MQQVTIQLTATIDKFIRAVNNQNIDWESKPLPGKWSNKEVIGHLCDSAKINLQRFVRCTYEENFKLTYEQDKWVAAQHYQEMNIDDLLQLWRLLNLQISLVLDNYPLDRLQAKCDNSKKETTLHTVEWLARDYLEHLQHHLNQIRFI